MIPRQPRKRATRWQATKASMTCLLLVACNDVGLPSIRPSEPPPTSPDGGSVPAPRECESSFDCPQGFCRFRGDCQSGTCILKGTCVEECALFGETCLGGGCCSACTADSSLPLEGAEGFCWLSDEGVYCGSTDDCRLPYVCFRDQCVDLEEDCSQRSTPWQQEQCWERRNALFDAELISEVEAPSFSALDGGVAQ